MKGLITDEGLESLITDLYIGANLDIKEVDSMLNRFYNLLGEQDDTNETNLTVFGENINNLLRNKYSARDQLFKVANLIKDRLKAKNNNEDSIESILDITELKKRLKKVDG